MTTARPFIPQRLIARREACGLSQDALAVKAGGVRGSSVAKYERGDRQPRLDVLVALAAALDCTVDDLLEPAAARRTHAIPA